MKNLLYFIIAGIVLTGCGAERKAPQRDVDVKDTVEVCDSDTSAVEEAKDSAFLAEQYRPLMEQLHEVQLKYSDGEKRSVGKERLFNEAFARTMSKFYRSLYPTVRLSESEKAAAMLKELEEAFYPEKALTNMDMIEAGDLKYSLLRYKLNMLTRSLIAEKRIGKTEVDAWERLAGALDEYISGVTRLMWFGGSGASAASTSGRIRLKEIRVNDLDLISQRHPSLQAKELISSNEATKMFLSAAEKALPGVSDEKELIEYYGKESVKAYRELEADVRRSYQQLPTLFAAWLKQRKGIDERVTSQMVNELSQAILDTDPHGQNYE